MTGRPDPLAERPPSQHAFQQADIALGLAGLPEENIFRAELRAAAADVASLVEAARSFERKFWEVAERANNRSCDHDVCQEVRDFRAALAPFGDRS